jgi:hypothetical protein
MDDEELFGLVEDRLVARLQAYGAEIGYEIEAFPDDGDALGISYSNGRVLVGFKRESFSQPQNLNAEARMVQERTLEYEVQINAKHLRTSRGVYAVIGRIRKILTGYQPLLAEKDRKRLYPVQAGYVKLTNNKVWVYSMTFSLSTTYSTDVRF